jgi:hypothetical protein
VLRLVFGTHLYDRQVGHVGPFFIACQAVHIQQIVDLAHTVSRVGNPYKYGGSYRDKGLNFAQGNLERLDVFAEFLKGFDRGGLIAGEVAGWEQGQVGSEMG